MSSDWAIRAEGLGKRYDLGETVSFRGLWRRQQRPSLWALRDATFEVPRGAVLGILGRNGAGKSTLLKLLTRVTAPTAGWAELRGRVGSLLEVGTGFHPELTGRENIYMNGVILGLRREEVARQFDAIVAFSGVEAFLDTPVKRYSSGMRVRLAFAVAAHLEPDILLVDEVLAVGDIEFQRRCLAKMDAAVRPDRTVLFVSHNMAALQQLCPEAMLIEGGRIAGRGATAEMVQRYLGGASQAIGHYNWPTGFTAEQGFAPQCLRVLDADGHPAASVSSQRPFHIELTYTLHERAPGLEIAFHLGTGSGGHFATLWEPGRMARGPGVFVSRCTVPAHQFAHGGFVLGVSARMQGLHWLYQDVSLTPFHIDGGPAVGDFGRGFFQPDWPWITERADASARTATTP